MYVIKDLLQHHQLVKNLLGIFASPVSTVSAEETQAGGFCCWKSCLAVCKERRNVHCILLIPGKAAWSWTEGSQVQGNRDACRELTDGIFIQL